MLTVPASSMIPFLIDQRPNGVKPLIEQSQNTFMACDLAAKAVSNISQLTGHSDIVAKCKEIRGAWAIVWTLSGVVSGSFKKRFMANPLTGSHKVGLDFFTGMSYGLNLVTRPLTLARDHGILANISKSLRLGASATVAMANKITQFEGITSYLGSKVELAVLAFDLLDAFQALRKGAKGCLKMERASAILRIVILAVDVFSRALSAVLALSPYEATPTETDTCSNQIGAKELKTILALISVGLCATRLYMDHCVKAQKAACAS